MMTTLMLLALLPGTPGEPCPEPHIQEHLARVEATLRAADTSHLSAAQRANRARHLDVLTGYREACEFPKNRHLKGRLTPIFVDEAGTHCAVGYLMMRDGQGALAQEIADTRNTATVQELADDPRVANWLEQAGLSQHEAARIQPTYCHQKEYECFCWNQATTVAEGQITRLFDEEYNGYVNPKAEVTLGNLYTRAGLAPTHATGDIVTVGAHSDDVVGRSILVSLAPDTNTGARPMLPDEDGTVSCHTEPDRDYYSISAETYINAMLAEDCHAHLREKAPHLDVSICGADGCSSAAPEPASPIAGAVLLALLGLLGMARIRQT